MSWSSPQRLRAQSKRGPIPFEKLSWNTPAADAPLLNVDRTVLDAAPNYRATAPPRHRHSQLGRVQQYWAGH